MHFAANNLVHKFLYLTLVSLKEAIRSSNSLVAGEAEVVALAEGPKNVL